MAYLIFDCNYILHKNVGSLHKLNRLYGELWASLDNNIAKYTSMSKWDNIFLVSDSRKKSWRKDYLDEYKGKRKPMEGVDMEWVYEQYGLWKDEKKEKYNVIERSRVEGDDWIASITRKANKDGQSVVIISSDGDMPQLLGYKINGEKSWINIQINDHYGHEIVYIPEGWELWLKEYDSNRSSDIFNLDNGYEWMNFFKRITDHWQCDVINPTERLFVKLVEGDKGDNIKSIYETLTKTGKIQGIGKSGAKKIWNFYKSNYKDYFKTTDATLADDIINCIEHVKNVKMSDERKDIVRKNLHRNIGLIELHYRHLPEWVLDEIVDELNEKV